MQAFLPGKSPMMQKRNKTATIPHLFLPIAQNAKEEEEEAEAFTSPALFNKIHWNLVGGSSKAARQLRCRHKKGIRSFEADRCVIRHNVFFFILFITLVTSKTLIFSSTSTSCRHWSQVVVVSSGLLQLELWAGLAQSAMFDRTSFRVHSFPVQSSIWAQPKEVQWI